MPIVDKLPDTIKKLPKDEKATESIATPEAGTDTSDGGKQAMLDGFDDDTLNEPPPLDLRESAPPPNLHISQGHAKCASCVFYEKYEEWCQLFKVPIAAIQLCDDYQTGSSFYNSKGLELVGEIQETEAEPVKAGARNSRGDQKALQAIHDNAKKLGAVCPDKKPYKKAPVTDVKSDAESSEKSCVPNCTGEYNNTLKIVEETPEGLILENYMMLYGDESHRDLEGVVNGNKNADGTPGEWFDPKTDFESQYTKTDNVILDWEHGKAVTPEPGRDDPLGKVLWKTAKSDKTGLLVQLALSRNSDYFEMLKTLAEMGVLASSSEAVMGGKIKTPAGFIEKWPIKRNTLTITPMEWRMYLSDQQLQELKALAMQYPTLKSILDKESVSASEVQRNKETKERLIIQYGISR